ncbi:MAG: flagellar hook-basal body complex protein FliE [Defluviitaleaceae bacterium]|nr:flagellar hook-basal body complex protein FliE [Defluviitaleaceae bacterium]
MAVITALVDTSPAMAPIQPFSPNLQLVQAPKEEQDTPFSSFFNAALNMYESTNYMVASSQQMQLDFATGRIDDILAVQMAMDRAINAVNFTSSITNKVVESYREIMRMQI